MRDRSRSPRSSSETLDLSGVPMSQVGQGQVAAEAAKLFEDNLETPPPRQPASETATGGQSSWTRLVEAPLSRLAHDEMMETTKDMFSIVVCCHPFLRWTNWSTSPCWPGGISC